MKKDFYTKICDLHTHSSYSDGTYTPSELIAEAKKIGLSAIALTDHNTVAGLDEFLAAAEGTGVEAVPGIELSTEWGGRELHILGLYIKTDDYSRLVGLVEDMKARKEMAYRECIASLRCAGYELDYDEICSGCKGQANRAHIARELVRRGYLASREEAFATLLHPSGDHYRAPKYLDAEEAIRFLKSIGAVAVWAHPYLNLTDEGVREFLPVAKAAGLDAMEVIYSRYDEKTTENARAAARDFGILESGGSDFHGPLKPDVALGVGRGNLVIPYQILENMRKIINK